ncbi:NAD(P)-binding Rossmann-fold containing protein [Glarea lozoyensis ATCC 20868]|uniref:NAD(P)-binding Rossmann-fold containing protein n=1 Tax=Glarea lozoyensis (strain ATCC 20868 / MF5171) TaxID=1116229 RepID=S3CFT8_GLAL2|nr:NAD(P)-binding Rossmann-fold containing protein [Glarea lozoyensis ATCC 20868]EPE24114.1 NAD(P)-binding Rossmann-fold containing protein [Glarea lozoyensis ATCC 20868]
MAGEEAPTTPHVLVIGGCGFLGCHIVQAFLAHNPTWKVSVASRSPTHNLRDEADYYAVDISKRMELESLLLKLLPTIIVNSASPLAHAGAQASTSTTIEGAALSLNLAAEIPAINSYIYISSASIASGMPFSLLPESDAKLINPETNHDPYSAAKATADSMVLAANQPFKLLTAVLRPSGIIGEHDAQVIPSLIGGMKQGMARFQFGDGKNKFDFVYAGNVADATVCCAKALMKEHTEKLQGGDKTVAGEAFWITNGEPMEFWSFARLVWRLAGDRTPPEKIITIPMWLMFFMAGIAEWVAWMLSAGKRRPQKFNKSQMQNCSMDRTFDVSKARERLDWEPKVTLEEGARRGVEWAIKGSQ